MEIKGKVHCFFEQSGTFKNQFKKLGYDAYDYDLQNNFNETDYVIDLFAEIEKGYKGEKSIFDEITKDDLIIAFFPCIYFESLQQTVFAECSVNDRKKTPCEKIKIALERLKNRTYFHSILYKLQYCAEWGGYKLIIENPATQPNYLISGQNFPTPSLIDSNRMLRGDYFIKPTAYWFFNCVPTHGFTYQNDKKQKTILSAKSAPKAGLCSEERSLISSNYARNFICDFILGKAQENSQLNLF